jgi:hypothetical protein
MNIIKVDNAIKWYYIKLNGARYKRYQMIYCNLKGGLCNMLFQIAATICD